MYNDLDLIFIKYMNLYYDTKEYKYLVKANKYARGEWNEQNRK